MRNTLLAILIAIPAASVVLSLVSGVVLKRFADVVGQIESGRDLKRFKRLAAWQMYLTLVVIGVYVIWTAALAWAFFSGEFRFMELIRLMLVISPVLFITGQAHKYFERRVQRLPISDNLRAERDRVVQTWLHSPFPDW